MAPETAATNSNALLSLVVPAAMVWLGYYCYSNTIYDFKNNVNENTLKENMILYNRLNSRDISFPQNRPYKYVSIQMCYTSR